MENLSETIKLPSNWGVVTPDSIWKYVYTISITGNTFNREQLIKAGLHTSNEDNISRNLSYLKYLGVVDEERARGQDQRFRVVDSKAVKDVLYELKAGRDDSARNKFKILLEQHSLYKTVKESFFGEESNKTLNDLEHFLRDGIPGKAPQYYQKGGEFIMKLLSLASLVKLSGNDIKLLNEENAKTEIPKLENPAEITPKSIESPPKPIASKEDAYMVRISSPNINVDVTIKKMAHLTLIESLLQTLRIEIEENLKEDGAGIQY